MISLILLKMISEKLAISLAVDWAKKNGEKFLGLSQTEFEIDLQKLIYKTIFDYDNKYPIEDEGEKIAFYKSEILLSSLLTLKFIGYDNINLDSIKNQLEVNPNIITPKHDDIVRFFDLFETNCKGSKTLSKHQLNSNYKEAIFRLLELVNSIQSTLSKIVKEIQTSLTEEYFAQLEEIQQNIFSFKPQTAFDRIESIEKRIRNSNKITSEIESKLFYLKGSCLLEIGRAIEGAELIIRAYIALNNETLKIEAAISYLNLNEKKEAKKLAEEIIKNNPFNGGAWFIILILNEDDFFETWDLIPQTVKEKRGFIVNVNYHLLLNQEFPVRFESLNINSRIPRLLDENINYTNITIWTKIVFIKLHSYFDTIHEISVDENGRLNNIKTEGLNEIVELLKKIFEVLKHTEVYPNYPVLRFYFAICRHLLGDNDFSKEELDEDYEKLKNTTIHFTIHYAQFYANNGNLNKALELLRKSKFANFEQAFLYTIIYTKAIGQSNEALVLLKEHIQFIPEIDFQNIFNLNNLFRLFLPNQNELKNELDYILVNKKYTSSSIKLLFELTIKINYLQEELHKENAINLLTKLVIEFNNKFDEQIFIAKLLISLNGYKEAVEILKHFIEPTKQTNSNFLYVEAMFRGNLDNFALMKFLEQIRNSNPLNLFHFLVVEGDLRKLINDDYSIIDISWKGVIQYPDFENFHFHLVSALERNARIDDLQKYVLKHIKSEFNNENIGITISVILSRNGHNELATKILYRLALNQSNSIARTAYATNSKFPAGFYCEFDVVFLNTYIKLVHKNRSIKFVEITGNNKYNNLIGKRLGDIVLITENISSSLKEFRIERIMNNHLYLLEQILYEAQDSNSELGLRTFNFSDENGDFDKNAFERTFIELFGSEKNTIDKIRNDYIKQYSNGEISFSEVCRGAFKDNALNCYHYLVESSFFVIPSLHNSALQLSDTEIYVLDFTSLILFSDLNKRFDVTFVNKFMVSINLVSLLRKGLIEVENSSKSEIGLVIDDKKINPIFYTENYFEKQINKYKELLDFIKLYCIEKINEEKVSLLSPLIHKSDGPYFDCLIDNFMFCTNYSYTLVSNDSFFIKKFDKINPKIISPENFITRFFTDDLHSYALEYYIENHYVGVTINKSILIEEFKKKQLNKLNSFQSCLLCLKTKWSLSPQNIRAGIQFLKYLYTENIGHDSEKHLIAQSIFANILEGYSDNESMIKLVKVSVYSEFYLLGDLLDKVLEDLNITLRII